ncbi:hypothetical protein L484_018586 [Morus notabilis]|uniref:Uncharacterized protein n=1 Tax=Morus notabilis TaxID=981085 RepID=W9R6W9_9ROSA|nr:hypothetical protein L484_018586 [Morus notabilis]
MYDDLHKLKVLPNASELYLNLDNLRIPSTLNLLAPNNIDEDFDIKRGSGEPYGKSGRHCCQRGRSVPGLEAKMELKKKGVRGPASVSKGT